MQHLEVSCAVRPI